MPIRIVGRIHLEIFVEETGLPSAQGVLDRRTGLEVHPFLKPVVENSRDESALVRDTRLFLNDRGERHELLRGELERLGLLSKVLGLILLKSLSKSGHHAMGRCRLLKEISVGEKKTFQFLALHNLEKFFSACDTFGLEERCHLLGHPAFRERHANKRWPFFKLAVEGEP